MMLVQRKIRTLALTWNTGGEGVNTEIPAGTGSYSSEQEVLLELYIILVTSFQVHNASHLYILQEDQEETGFICV